MSQQLSSRAATGPTAPSPRSLAIACGLAATAVGIGIAALSFESLATAAAIVVALAVVVLVFAEPMLGVGLTLFFAPFGPLENIYLGLPLESGQVVFGLTLAAWLAERALGRGGLAVREVGARPIALALMAFMAVGVASFFPAQSFEPWLKECVKWAQVLVMFVIVASERAPRKRAIVIGAMLASLAFQGAFGIAQFGLLGFGPKEFTIVKDSLWRAHGTLEQPNPYGGYVGLLWPVAMGVAIGFWALFAGDLRSHRHEAKRHAAIAALATASAVLGLGGLVASWSRGAWLGAGAAALAMVIVLVRRPLVALGAVVAGAVAVAALGAANALPDSIRARLTDFAAQFTSFDVRGVSVSADNYSVIERLAHWQAGARMIEDNPWLGVGFGNYAAAYERFRLFAWSNPLGHAHNFYINVWAELGVFGLLAYVAVWGIAVGQTIWLARRALRRDIVMACVAAGLLGAWTHLTVHHIVDNLYVANTFLLVGALLGLLESFTGELRAGMTAGRVGEPFAR